MSNCYSVWAIGPVVCSVTSVCLSRAHKSPCVSRATNKRALAYMNMNEKKEKPLKNVRNGLSACRISMQMILAVFHIRWNQVASIRVENLHGFPLVISQRQSIYIDKSLLTPNTVQTMPFIESKIIEKIFGWKMIVKSSSKIIVAVSTESLIKIKYLKANFKEIFSDFLLTIFYDWI